jgi:hypothetical protein
MYTPMPPAELIYPLILTVAALAAVVLIARYVLQRKHALHQLASQFGHEDLKSGTAYEGRMDGCTYYYEYYAGSKNRPSYFRIWLDCPAAGSFRLGREGWLEGLFKRLGVSVEIQTGDSRFDREFYIQTDTVDFTTGFLASPDTREAIRRIYAGGFREFSLDGETIEARRTPFSPAKDTIGLETEAVVRELKRLTGQVPEESGENRMAGMPAWKLRRNVVYVLTGLAAAAGLGLTLLGLKLYTPLRAMDVFIFSLGYVVPALLVFTVASIHLLKGRSASYKDVLYNFLFSLIGFPLSGFGGAMVLNGALDEADVIYHDARVTGKHYTTSRNSRNYYLEITSWNGKAGGEKIKVSHTVYRRAKVDRSVLIVGTRPGRLGFEWITAYRIRRTP